jgi:hypothetical protein
MIRMLVVGARTVTFNVWICFGRFVGASELSANVIICQVGIVFLPDWQAIMQTFFQQVADMILA